MRWMWKRPKGVPRIHGCRGVVVAGEGVVWEMLLRPKTRIRHLRNRNPMLKLGVGARCSRSYRHRHTFAPSGPLLMLFLLWFLLLWLVLRFVARCCRYQYQSPCSSPQSASTQQNREKWSRRGILAGIEAAIIMNRKNSNPEVVEKAQDPEERQRKRKRKRPLLCFRAKR